VGRLLRIVLLLSSLSVLASPAPAAQSQAPSRVEDHFTPAQIERAAAYRKPRYVAAFSSLAVALATVGFLGLGPGTRRLGAWSHSLTGGRWWLQAALLAAAVTVISTLLRLGFSIWRWSHDRSFGLATNSLVGHLADVVKATGFEILIGVVSAAVFIGLARALPRAWPLAAAAGGMLLTFLLVYLFPLVYEPAFNRFDPVEGPTRDRIVALAARAGVAVDEVLVADASRRTTRENAYVSGIGSSKRVVLYDNLLNARPPEQVDAVVAHELAHVKHGDVLRGTMMACVGVAAGVAVLWWILSLERFRDWLGVSGPGDAAVVPFLAFFIAATGLVTLPLQNAISRSVEARADRTSIELTGDAKTVIDLQVELAVDNVSDLDPNGFIAWMFFTHPPTLERIDAARAACGEPCR